ncbi:Glycosyltransferase involved in cell wall bisynthesis [Candidatus Kryptobacter tengchongensis]|nr:Glycosyltransferase involved in cell wall bisynthesis [Candidatus Kryptobacter tengchongensis]
MGAPVSVIIPCYNAKDTIERAVQSVYNQTWRPAELIVVDDGSEVETIEFLRKLKKEYGDWMKLIELKKNSGGPSVPRNVGWDNASQPYIAFLDDDDAWHVKKIEIQLNFMLNHPEFSITAHKVYVVKDGQYPINLEIYPDYQFRNVNKWLFLFRNLFVTSSVVLRKDLPFRFESNLKFSEDYHLWLRIILSGNKGALLDLPLAFWFRPFFSPGGISSKLWDMEKDEIKVYLDLVQHGYVKKYCLPFLISFSLLKFLRRKLISLKWK